MTTTPNTPPPTPTRARTRPTIEIPAQLLADLRELCKVAK